MIAYVDSPFQLLQCYEFTNSIKEINHIYIRLNGKLENDRQLTRLAGYLKLKNIRLVKIETLFERIRYYIFFLIKSFFVNKIIFGDSNSFIFRILSFFHRSGKFILLDDGVATINDHYKSLKFERFTIFPRYVKKSLQNDFLYTKKLVRKGNYDKRHIIIGSKFVDEGICSQLIYSRALKAIVENLNCDVDVLYVAHRGESENQLEFLKREFSFQIIRTDYPIELLPIEINIYPVTISSVLSTAVFSMSIIYNNTPIYTYRIAKEELKSRVEGVENIYAQLKDESISTFIY